MSLIPHLVWEEWPHLDEVAADAVISFSSNGPHVLRNHLQTLQHLTLWAAQSTWAAYTDMKTVITLNSSTDKFTLHIHVKWHALTSNYTDSYNALMYLSFCSLRLVVRMTAMFSQALSFSPCPGVSQPSWLQHSSNTALHFCSAGTAW